MEEKRKEGKKEGGLREMKGREGEWKEGMIENHTRPHLCSSDHKNPIISFVFPLSMIL